MKKLDNNGPGGVLPGDVRAADGGAERDLLPPGHRALAGPGPPHHTHHGQQEEGQGQAEGMNHLSKNILISIQKYSGSVGEDVYRDPDRVRGVLAALPLLLHLHLPQHGEAETGERGHNQELIQPIISELQSPAVL